MPRFYCPLPLSIGASLALPDHVAHHIQVLRLLQGAMITLFNGEGGEYTATLSVIEKKRVQVDIKAFAATDIELPYAITLAQALPESSKMDWIIEKAVELGVAGVHPLSSQRCVVRLSAERAEKKIAHWQGIIISASEQSGRNRLAQLTPPSQFNQWIEQQDLHKRILLSPRATQSLANWAQHQPPQAVTLMIGPEGGFSGEEEELAIARGALLLSMGARVLRTETAGLAAVAMLNALWDGR